MKKLIFTLLACIVAFGVASAKTLTINVASGPITVDGTADEDAWTAPQFNNLDQNKGDAANKNNTSKFKMTYDAKFLYIYVEVLDSKIDTSQSTNPWEKDCIEVFVSLDTTNRSYSNGQGSAFQSRKVFGRDLGNDGGSVDKGFMAVEQDIAGGKSQEWSLPWDSIASTLTDATKWDHKNFRFEMQNGDNDGSGRLSQLFWNSPADDQWNNTTNQGYAVTQYYVSVRDLNENAEIIVINNFVRVKNIAQIEIYNVNGQKIKSGYGTELNVSDLAKNQLYIATANGVSKKFILK